MNEEEIFKAQYNRLKKRENDFLEKIRVKNITTKKPDIFPSELSYEYFKLYKVCISDPVISAYEEMFFKKHSKDLFPLDECDVVNLNDENFTSLENCLEQTNKNQEKEKYDTYTYLENIGLFSLNLAKTIFSFCEKKEVFNVKKIFGEIANLPFEPIENEVIYKIISNVCKKCQNLKFITKRKNEDFIVMKKYQGIDIYDRILEETTKEILINKEYPLESKYSYIHYILENFCENKKGKLCKYLHLSENLYKKLKEEINF